MLISIDRFYCYRSRKKRRVSKKREGHRQAGRVEKETVQQKKGRRKVNRQNRKSEREEGPTERKVQGKLTSKTERVEKKRFCYFLLHVVWVFT